MAIAETLQPGLSSPEIVAQDHGSYVSVSVQSGVSTTAPLSISLQIGSVYARETYNGNPSDNPQFVAVSVFNPPTAVVHTGASNAGGGTTFPDRSRGRTARVVGAERPLLRRAPHACGAIPDRGLRGTCS